MFTLKVTQRAHKMGRILTIFALVCAHTAPAPAFSPSAEFLDLPPGYQQLRACSFNLIGFEDIPSEQPVRLTSGWSQEGVGTPEVQRYLRKNEIDLRWVRTGVLDDRFSLPHFAEHIDQPADVSASIQSQKISSVLAEPSHGNHVAAVIGGRQYGLTQNALFSKLVSYGDLAEITLASDGKPIEIYNRSLSVSHETNAQLQRLLTRNNGHPFLLVNSAGNEYLINLVERGMHTAYFEGTPALIVSAITPSGRINPHSGGGPQAVVGAPSFGPGLMHPQQYEQNLDGGWTFSGTSAAAPMVTGALVGVLGLLEGLTYAEARELLIQTSFRTRSFQEGHNFGGYGVLNYYQMMRVAHRLHESGWPESRNLIFQSGPGSVYDFTSEAKSLFDAAKNFIHYYKTGSCADKKSLLRLLRESFFLNPDQESTRQALFVLYANENYHDQALYFAPLSFEYNGSGIYSKPDLERSLLNSLATGNFSEAILALQRGRSDIDRIYSFYVLHTAASLTLQFPSQQRGEFIALTRNSLSGDKREFFVDLLLGQAQYLQQKNLYRDLLDAGVEFEPEYASRSLYLCVVQKCDGEIMTLLREQGADVDYQNRMGISLLSFAAYGGNLKAVEFLLKEGARVNLPDNRGQTPLDFALGKEAVDVVRLLIRAGAHVSKDQLNQVLQSGNSALLTVIRKELEARNLGRQGPLA